MQVRDLCGGDLVGVGGQYATFIGASNHPTYNSLALVVWQMDDGSFSLDALDWHQEIGFMSSFRDDNMRRLRKIFDD